MPVLNSEIKIYGAANIAEANGVTQGGAIDTSVRYIFDDSSYLVHTDTFNVVSDNSGDTTQTVTITGRDGSGRIITEEYSLAGLTVQNGGTMFYRILKITCSAAHSGNIIITDNHMSQTVLTMEAGVLEVRIPFYNVAADVEGGETRNFYEKVFVKNTSGISALLNASISEQADTGANITFDLEDAVDDNNSIASRLNTAPSGMLGTFTNTAKNVPGTDLAAGSAIGVWLKLTLIGGAATADNTYTLRVSGESL